MTNTTWTLIEEEKTDKEKLKTQLQDDTTLIRNACRNLIVDGQKVNQQLIENLVQEDLSQLEEYTMISKSITDAAKLLADTHQSVVKTTKEIEKIKEQKEKVNLDDLIQ